MLISPYGSISVRSTSGCGRIEGCGPYSPVRCHAGYYRALALKMLTLRAALGNGSTPTDLVYIRNAVDKAVILSTFVALVIIMSRMCKSRVEKVVVLLGSLSNRQVS